MSPLLSYSFSFLKETIIMNLVFIQSILLHFCLYICTQYYVIILIYRNVSIVYNILKFAF